MTKAKSHGVHNLENRKDGLTSHDRITLIEAKARLHGPSDVKLRGGQSKSRHARMLRRGHKLFDWMLPKK